MRIDEVTGPGVSYEKALTAAANVKALTVITGGDFSDNTATTVLGIAYPGRSYNERQADWKKAVAEQIKKEKFVMNLRIGKLD